ncbi:MAG: cysteine desulfurase, partial [Thermoprotei archaeon]
MGVGLAKRKNRGKIVVSSIEHLSVIFPAERLEKLFGFKVVQIPVSKEGFVEPELFQLYVDRDTVLVSIQLVNHEIGCIQPLKELVDIARSANPDVIFHTDAVDAYGRLRLDVERLGVDLVTLSSHKILGPKGIGVLYVRPGVELESVILGQLSTQKMWPGVENVPAIAGFKKAIELAFENFDENVSKMRRLRDRLMKGIQERVSDVLINGPLGEKRVVDNANMSFLYVEGEALTVELSLRGVYVSSGSACTSRHLEPSHVLLAIGRKYEEAHGSILFKVTRYHCDDDIDYVISQVPQAVERLRKLSAIKSKKNK